MISFFRENSLFMKLLRPIFLGVFFVSASFPQGMAPAFAQNWKESIVKHDFPRTGMMYLSSSQYHLGADLADEFSKYDVAIFHPAAQEVGKDLLTALRKKNPDIILLAYFNLTEFPKYGLKDVEIDREGIYHDLASKMSEEWYLNTAENKEISLWPKNVVMNLSGKNKEGQTYGDFLATYLAVQMLGSGLWDGIFFDVVWDSISWSAAGIDIDHDGKADEAAFIDRRWQEGHQGFFKKMREIVGDEYLLIGNTIGNYYTDHLNGRGFEDFPYLERGGWNGAMKNYREIEKDSFGKSPRAVFFNADVNDSGKFDDYRAMRYALGSSLLGNAYFNFDNGPKDRTYVWRYDEYDANLGFPTTDAKNMFPLGKDASGSLPASGRGVWGRDFDYGSVFVNSTYDERVIALPYDHEKLRGGQDPDINDGRIVSELTLNGQDGILLLHPLNEIASSVFENGAFARVFDASGEVIRNGFFAYESTQKEDEAVLKQDIDFDGIKEILTAQNGAISIFEENGELTLRFFPYGEAYTGEVHFVVADLEGDGTLEIVTGAGEGGGPHVRIFNTGGKLLSDGFFAYEKNFRGGVNVAVGDVDGDGQKEIITGAGVGGGPHVRMFRPDGRAVNAGFFAFDSTFRGGVHVVSGDLDGDGRDEIVASPVLGGDSQVAVFDMDGHRGESFQAFGNNGTSEITLALSDMDHDGMLDIVVMTRDVFRIEGK